MSATGGVLRSAGAGLLAWLMLTFLVAPAHAAGEECRPRRQADDPRAMQRAAQAAAAPASAGGGSAEAVAGPAIPGAIAWLASSQQLSGSWGSAFEFADTATCVDALGLAQNRGQPFQRGAGWLAGHVAADNDALARKMLALDRVAALSLDEFAESLLQTRNAAATNPVAPNYPEGGWGLLDGYETDSLTTALALAALEAAGRKAGIGVAAQPLAPSTTNVHPWEIASDAVKARIRITVSGSTVRLRMRQGAPPTLGDPYFPLGAGFTYEIVFPDSGLPFTPGTNYISVESPNPPGTAATYSFTASYQTATFDTRAFAEALDYLRQAQNGDGSWGVQRGDPASLYTTLHVMLALQRYRDYGLDAELADGIAYLLSVQNAGGSFGAGASAPYMTALAALLLIQEEVCPFSAATEQAVTSLLAMQSMDGSWSAEPYDTALALRAIWEYDSDGDGVFADGDCSGSAGDDPCPMGTTALCDDVCVDYFNADQGPVVFGQTVAAPDRTRLSWPDPVDAAWVKGDLSTVSSYGILQGGFVSFSTFLDITADLPAPGTGYYYLFRPGGDCATASWQSSPGAEPGRDTANLGEVDIAITSPADGAIVTTSPAAVTGTVAGADPIAVTVNGVAAPVTAGTFSAPVPLVRGVNVITASAVDAAGFMGQDQITLTKVDYSIGRPGFVTGSRIFTAASATLDQTAFFTQNIIGIPAGVTYTTQSVSRISATQMQVGFRIDVAAGAAPGIRFFQVDYGLLDSSLNPLGPLTGDVFDFLIQIL